MRFDWREANTPCDWLTQNISARELPSEYNRFCLPTEAEWQHACRVGTETDYYNGDGEAALSAVGWYDVNSGSETHPVDEKSETHPHRLFGMHGNVREWCHDLYDSTAYRLRADGVPDPWLDMRRAEWAAGSTQLVRADDDRIRVVRGGSWLNPARYSAYQGSVS